MTTKIEGLPLGELLVEYPIDFIGFILCAIIIFTLYCKSSSRFLKIHKTHVERSTPYSVILFETISCIFSSSLLMYLTIFTKENNIVVHITALYCSLVFTFFFWIITGAFAYLDYKNNKPNLEYQKMWDELDEELYIIEEERVRLSIKIPNNDEHQNFHDMVNKYNAKLETLNAKGEQLK